MLSLWRIWLEVAIRGDSQGPQMFLFILLLLTSWTEGVVIQPGKVQGNEQGQGRRNVKGQGQEQEQGQGQGQVQGHKHRLGKALEWEEVHNKGYGGDYWQVQEQELEVVDEVIEVQEVERVQFVKKEQEVEKVQEVRKVQEAKKGQYVKKVQEVKKLQEVEKVQSDEEVGQIQRPDQGQESHPSSLGKCCPLSQVYFSPHINAA